MIKKPYDYQQDAIDAVFRYFQNGGKGNPLVVAPTGSGKSVIISELCRIIKRNWPEQHILVLAHDASILQQNYDAIVQQTEGMPFDVGLYSSGLKSREIEEVTVAGIQSCYNKADDFKHFDIILLDEAHTVSYKKTSRYRTFFNAVKKKVVGFTATPYRLGTGYLHLGDDAFFDDIVYTIKLSKLQELGRLCQVTSKKPSTTLDASQIKKQSGDFIVKELSMAFDRKSITQEIVSELIGYKNLRKKWLVYAIDIEHCEHIAETLNEMGIKTAVLHSKLKTSRDFVLDKFRAGEYQAVVSVAMLTTGLDIPEVDMIVLLRPTASPVLHVQIIGRGMRIAEGKEDCLVLDYAGNLMRNGPIDAPTIKTNNGKGGGEPIMKECDQCCELVHIAVRICPSCGANFQFQHHLTLGTSDADVISMENWHEVEDVEYYPYTGAKNITMLRVDYLCGLRIFKEYICIEHGGYATAKAHHWWKRRSSVSPPDTTKQSLDVVHTLDKPDRILVNESGRYPEIKMHEF